MEIKVYWLIFASIGFRTLFTRTDFKSSSFLLEKDIIHTYVPYLLLPYNKSIKVIEPISLKKRLIEILSELIKFHQV